MTVYSKTKRNLYLYFAVYVFLQQSFIDIYITTENCFRMTNLSELYFQLFQEKCIFAIRDFEMNFNKIQYLTIP